MKARSDELDLDALVQLDKVPAAGRTETIKTDETQRELLARRFDVDGVHAFDAKLVISRFRGGYRVEGDVAGTVVQPCVVTGDPVVQHIEQRIDRVFLPARDEAVQAGAGAEVFVNLEDEDFPDYFEGNEIDLADVAMEVFALAIDLYPRAPGAELPLQATGDDPAEASPFAALRQLGKDKGN